MTQVGKFDFSKYDVGGEGATAGDGKLTGDEAKKARADGWTVWDEFREDDTAKQVETDKNNKLVGALRLLLAGASEMHKSESYKKYVELREKLLEEKLAKYDIHPSKIDGQNCYFIDVVLFDDKYKKAYDEAVREAKQQLGLSENAFNFGIKLFDNFRQTFDKKSAEKTKVKDDVSISGFKLFPKQGKGVPEPEFTVGSIGDDEPEIKWM